MSIDQVGDRTTVGRSLSGWYFFALCAFASLVVADYQGPLIATAFAIASVGLGVLGTIARPLPQFPSSAVWLVAILVIGLVSAVLANAGGQTVLDTDLQRDLGTSISYVLFFVAGCYFAYERRTLPLILIAIIAAGLIISFVHLVRLSEVLSSGVTDLYLFRLDAGRGSNTQFAALCACLILSRGVTAAKHRRLLVACSALLVLSMLMTLSRGLMVLLIALILGVSGLTADRVGRLVADLPRFVLGTVSVCATSLGVYLLLLLFAPAAHRFIDEFFIARVGNSLAEVSTTRLETSAQISENYRAFEADRAVRQFDEQPAFAQWIGQGWGSSVKFGFDTASTKVTFQRTEAAFLHNGYAYFLMKAGIVGVVLYIGFMAHLAWRALFYLAWPRTDMAVMQRKVLFVAVIGLAVGTVTTGGIGFPAGYLGLVMLLGACYGTAGSGYDARRAVRTTPPEDIARWSRGA
jgi:O-antigen ligase